MLKLHPKKEFVIPDEEEGFSITWRFPYSTSSQVEKIKEAFNGREFASITEEILVNAMIAQTGIIDESTGKDLDLTSEDSRRALFDYVKSKENYWIKVVAAAGGARGKNLLAGAMQSSPGNGSPVSVSNAASEVVKQEAAPTLETTR